MKQRVPISRTIPCGTAKAAWVVSARSDRRWGPALQRGDQGGCAGAEKGADSAGAGDAADAVKAVEAGHDRAPAVALDDDGLDVHDAVERAEAGAEDEQG
jgi:hypothetical protein